MTLPETEHDGVLVLSNDDVRVVFDMNDCVRLLEEGFAMLGSGEAVNPLRIDRSIRCDPEAFDGGDGPRLLPIEDDDRREHGGRDDTYQLRYRPLADRTWDRPEGEDSHCGQ